MSCKPPLAGAGRRKNHAIKTPKVSQWVAVNKAARDVKDTAEQVTPVTAEVPDATENLNIEFKRENESEEQFLGVRDVLEQLTQKAAIARDERRLAEEAVLIPESRGRELPEKLLQEQTTLEWNVESDWNGGSDWINLHIRDECWSRRSSCRNDAGLAYGHEQIQRVESADAAEVQSSTRDQKNGKSVRQVDWRMLSAHRWVRQSASHSRSTPHPRVTDQGMFDEHE